MKTKRIAVPPTFKSILSLVLTAVAFGFTLYFTCSGKDLHASHTPRKVEAVLSTQPEEDSEREALEREAEDLWVKQYGLDQKEGGIWTPVKEAPRSPEEQKKIDEIVRAVDQYWVKHYGNS